MTSTFYIRFWIALGLIALTPLYILLFLILKALS